MFSIIWWRDAPSAGRILGESGRRLSAGELAVLGCYLYGRRWRAPLARALRVDYRLVRRWARGEIPVSARCSALILELVRRRRIARRAAIEALLAVTERRYRAMLDGLSAGARTALVMSVADLTSEGATVREGGGRHTSLTSSPP